MSAYLVCDEVVERIESGKYDVIILNYANCDMVGHTGVFDAAVKAVEAVDTCVGRTVDAIRKMGGIALITADHGNADKMYGGGRLPPLPPTPPIRCPSVSSAPPVPLRQGGRLCDIAPTMLQFLGIDQPIEMDGKSLVERLGRWNPRPYKPGRRADTKPAGEGNPLRLVCFIRARAPPGAFPFRVERSECHKQDAAPHKAKRPDGARSRIESGARPTLPAGGQPHPAGSL